MKTNKKTYLSLENYNAVKKQYGYTEKQMRENNFAHQREADIQIEFLKVAKHKYPDLIFSAFKNESNTQRGFLYSKGIQDKEINFMQSKMNAKAKKMGVVKGMPDILVLGKDVIFFLEFKNAKGGVRAEQMETIDKIMSFGFDTFIVKTVDEALAMVDEMMQQDITF
jgi:hypothetical protein